MTRAPDRLWAGKPVYQCRWCAFERVSRLDRVDTHEREAHPEQFEPPVTRIVRESFLLGADGRPALIEEPAGADREQHVITQ